MHKRSILLVSILTFSSLSITGTAGNRAEFEQWMKQETTSFQEYRDKRDKEFTGFLKNQWKEMQTFQGIVRDKTPKPVRMPKAPIKPAVPIKQPDPVPVIKPITDTPQTKPVIKSPVKVTPPSTPKPVIVNVPVIKPVPAPVKVVPAPLIKKPKGMKVHLTFYGQSLDFYYDPKLKVSIQRPINEKSMSRIWSEMSKADYEGLLKQINAQRKPLILNDWGYALLTNAIAQKIHPGSKNDQSVFTWYLMTKAGYQARIAYDSNYVYLLMPSRQQLFAAPYFTFDKIRYYALSFDGIKQKPGRIFTYDGHYPGAQKRLDMSLSHAFNTGRKQQDRFLNFTYKGKTHRINVGYDKETIRYLKTYPQMDITLYFNSELNQATANPLLKQLKPLVEGKSEEDAVNLILRFVQTAFKYKTDEQQFGIENYLFPEETLHYPYSDCEDRSVFFAWIVHHLLGLQVVGLDYPGHISAAVHFNENVRGDAVSFNGKRYVVTDPTYINANSGMAMPAYKNKKPGVIRVLN
ncbi:MAG: hypothetical protein DIZ80_10345 [endosymbiont of Galathealinum brachiosum]|uniref:Transglutaminase-like domain-containing protein n=1 Tax=endosymbiont of Galathealinum brachiosum TaxID=2200906 RepID=A0A370DDL8_9GAMM|nr:MAG: hypothetical protein DIZ80_10345 [endosymbiont of Galathealinum brachiosum]